MIVIRDAVPGDLPAITQIYNEAILQTDAVMHTEPRSVEEQQAWFGRHGEKYPVLVAELAMPDAAPVVVGWGSLSPWSERCGYAGTVELSFYVKEEQRGKGAGKKIFQALLDRSEKLGHHVIVSLITAGNMASIRIHEQFGFQHAGLLKEVGFKFDHWKDVALLQKIL